MDSEKIFKDHMTDLASRASRGGYYTYSDFLSLAEQDTLLKTKTEVSFSFYGGYENSERKIAVFGSEDDFGYSEEAPIACIQVTPLSQKYADALSHRDFLGSVTGLGIKRDVTGDIIIHENTAYIFCLESISDFIIENLKKVKHTDVKCNRVYSLPEEIESHKEDMTVFSSSERADAVVAAVLNISRNESEKLFSQKLIFSDSKLIEKPDMTLKEGSIVSVRGHGRFLYCGISKTTKKGRFCIKIQMYK